MSELSVADVLERAAALIEPEGKWTQGDYYRDGEGNPVRDVEDAHCYCALGAIRAVGGYDSTGEKDWNPASHILEGVLDITAGVHGWNDHPKRTQAEVVAKLREAAALARSTTKVSGE